MLVSALVLLQVVTPSPARRIAVTLDDLPGVTASPGLAARQDLNRRILAALRAARVPAIGFVNESALHVEGERDARAALLRGWLDAGMTLGNHTYRHKGLNDTPLGAYQDDVIRGEVITRRLLEERGHKLVYFRHPMTHTGPTAEIKQAFERFLSERGYRIAPFTIEHQDWAFNAVYEDALARGAADEAQKLREESLAQMEKACAFFEARSRELFEREIAQILLIHVNRLNADLLPQMLVQLTRRGYRFVGLDEALADEAYRTTDLYVGTNGPSWLHRWTIARKRPMRLDEEPAPSKAFWERHRALGEKRRSAKRDAAASSAPR